MHELPPVRKKDIENAMKIDPLVGYMLMTLYIFRQGRTFDWDYYVKTGMTRFEYCL